MTGLKQGDPVQSIVGAPREGRVTHTYTSPVLDGSACALVEWDDQPGYESSIFAAYLSLRSEVKS